MKLKKTKRKANKLWLILKRVDGDFVGNTAVL